MIILFVLGIVFFILAALNVPAGKISWLPLALLCWFAMTYFSLLDHLR
jgi:hypothetical protein